MSDKRVVITGVGPVSAIGIGRAAFFDGLAQGRSGIAPFAAGPAAGRTAQFAAALSGFDVRDYLESEKPYLDRASQLAFAALSLALEDANLDLKALDRAAVGLLLGSSAGCLDSMRVFFADFLEKGPRLVKPIVFPHTYHNTPISLLAIEYGLDGFHLNFAAGAVSASCAILEGYDRIRQGRNPLVIAGGFEALSDVLVRGYERLGVLSPSAGGGPERCAPFAAGRNGFVLGEGAGIVVLEELAHARARGASIYGELLGGGMAGERTLAPGGTGAGSGILKALRLAGQALPSGRQVPDYISASANGSPVLDRLEAQAIREWLGDRAGTVAVGSVKAMLGETLGASGVLQLIAALAALRTGRIPPTLNLETPEAGFGLNFVLASGLERPVEYALLNAIDPGGSAVCLLVGSADRG